MQNFSSLKKCSGYYHAMYVRVESSLSKPFLILCYTLLIY